MSTSLGCCRRARPALARSTAPDRSPGSTATGGRPCRYDAHLEVVGERGGRSYHRVYLHRTRSPSDIRSESSSQATTSRHRSEAPSARPACSHTISHDAVTTWRS
jgi:hypothetical protein